MSGRSPPRWQLREPQTASTLSLGSPLSRLVADLAPMGQKGSRHHRIQATRPLPANECLLPPYLVRSQPSQHVLQHRAPRMLSQLSAHPAFRTQSQSQSRAGLATMSLGTCPEYARGPDRKEGCPVSDPAMPRDGFDRRLQIVCKERIL